MNWIKFKERHPEESGNYLVACTIDKKRFYFVCPWILHGDDGFWFKNPDVSHWCEIEEAPVIETIQ